MEHYLGYFQPCSDGKCCDCMLFDQYYSVPSELNVLVDGITKGAYGTCGSCPPSLNVTLYPLADYLNPYRPISYPDGQTGRHSEKLHQVPGWLWPRINGGEYGGCNYVQLCLLADAFPASWGRVVPLCSVPSGTAHMLIRVQPVRFNCPNGTGNSTLVLGAEVRSGIYSGDINTSTGDLSWSGWIGNKSVVVADGTTPIQPTGLGKINIPNIVSSSNPYGCTPGAAVEIL